MTRRQRSDPALYRGRTGSRRPTIARHPGHCDDCGEPWVVGVTQIQRVAGRELHIGCAGKE